MSNVKKERKTMIEGILANIQATGKVSPVQIKVALNELNNALSSLQHLAGELAAIHEILSRALEKEAYVQ